MPPFWKEGHIALHMSVSMSVSLNPVQLITQECFAQEASNFIIIIMTIGKYTVLKHFQLKLKTMNL